MCFKMDEFQLQLEILAIENGYCVTVLICYCYSCVYVKAAKQYIETCVVRVQKMHSSGSKSTHNRHNLYVLLLMQ